LVEIGFSIRRVFGRFAALLGQIPVAVLMAVRCQLSCILLLRIARKVAIATYSHQTVYATICERLDALQNLKKQTQNPPTLAVMGVRPPLPAPALNNLRINDLENHQSLVPKVPNLYQDSSYGHRGIAATQSVELAG
jgi:hypothetical protein